MWRPGGGSEKKRVGKPVKDPRGGAEKFDVHEICSAPKKRFPMNN